MHDGFVDSNTHAVSPRKRNVLKAFNVRAYACDDQGYKRLTATTGAHFGS